MNRISAFFVEPVRYAQTHRCVTEKKERPCEERSRKKLECLCMKRQIPWEVVCLTPGSIEKPLLPQGFQLKTPLEHKENKTRGRMEWWTLRVQHSTEGQKKRKKKEKELKQNEGTNEHFHSDSANINQKHTVQPARSEPRVNLDWTRTRLKLSGAINKATSAPF